MHEVGANIYLNQHFVHMGNTKRVLVSFWSSVAPFQWFTYPSFSFYVPIYLSINFSYYTFSHSNKKR